MGTVPGTSGSTPAISSKVGVTSVITVKASTRRASGTPGPERIRGTRSPPSPAWNLKRLDGPAAACAHSGPIAT
jgi:hypothetical protein